MPNAPGQVVEYDFWGPVFGIFLFLGFYDIFTGIVKLSMIRSASAVTVVHCLNSKWAPDQGYPIELIADIGSGCKNALVELIYSLFHIQGLYSSPRRHQAIGGIETTWRRMNMAARAINLKLDGVLTDALERDRAVGLISVLLPSIEMALNASAKTVTGISPNELDKGRKLRDIQDLDAALATLRKGIENGWSITGAAEYLQNLNLSIRAISAIKNEKNLKYVKRYKFRYDKSIFKEYQYKIGDLVCYFIGDRSNRNTGQWWPKYMLYKVKEIVRNGNACRIVAIDNPKEEYTVARAMLVPYHDGKDWMNELDYQKMIQARQHDMEKNQKRVGFAKDSE